MPTDQPILEYFPDADTAGFRLHELEVLNWGTFHGRAHAVRPEGRTAILTGGNGTGKSTLADALLTLLVPNTRRNYNQAGQTQKKSERNERDYVLGAFSEKHDEIIGAKHKQYLRKDASTHSVLLASFHNQGLNSWVTLAQVLWINTANKVEKVFLVEPRRLSIKADLSHLDTPASLRRVLRDRGLIGLDSFTAYSDKFHDLLCLPKEKTPMTIFNQAICIKDISDLTSFIREHMLDDGGAMEKLHALRRNFTELRETNRRIELASKQLDALNLLTLDHQRLVMLQQDLDDLFAREHAQVPFFAEQEISLRTALLERQRSELDALGGRQEAASSTMETLSRKLASIEKALAESNEGRRLAEIEQLLQERSTARDLRKKRRADFEALLVAWEPNRQVSDFTTHGQLLRQCELAAPSLQQRLDQIEQTELPRLRIEQHDVVTDRDRLEAEQRSLFERTSNLPESSIHARQYLLDELRLQPEDLPFVGELVQVLPAEGAWTGAIELLMHTFALCMVVRRDLRERVDSFVHAHRQRGLVVYHAVPDQIGAVNPRLPSAAVASKLELKSDLGDVGRWLEVEISYRFDHVCCTDTGAPYHQAANALTLNGLIKQKGTERRKDDRRPLGDASTYVLGWDNREKLVALGVELKALEAKLAELGRRVSSLGDERKHLQSRLKAAEELQRYFKSYQEIDWASVAKDISDLEAEQTRLKVGSDQLKRLAQDKADTETALSGVKKEEKVLIGEIAVAKSQLETNMIARSKLEGWVRDLEQTASVDARYANYRSQFPAIKASLAFPLTDLQLLAQARADASDSIRRSRGKANSDFNERAHRIKRAFEAFVADTDNIEFKDQLAGDFTLPGYNVNLFTPFAAVQQQLIAEDLPKNQKRFERLLHTEVADDVHVFDELLERHAKRIETKIRELNQQLRKIDFDRREKTYIQLVPTRTEDDSVKAFRNFRRHALDGSLNAGTDTEGLKERYHRIELLLNKLDENADWTNRVIDVRNWFVFRAKESFREGDVHKQDYSGASGKSGGEKNRLASTILATAIAYQYGISVGDRQTETFRLVVVDEMFSKTDDEFSEYLLELFKEFHLQLLIIQPLDAKIHLVQKFVERYHIVTKRGAISSVRTLSVKEYDHLGAAP